MSLCSLPSLPGEEKYLIPHGRSRTSWKPSIPGRGFRGEFLALQSFSFRLISGEWCLCEYFIKRSQYRNCAVDCKQGC
ncbi:hypothetical protein HMPREF1326_02874 [Akkermansia sp. KLE1605]|nr:hypothetical protein HMPREF1326_02874 [Akkermansia sp. KLE1605]